MFGTTKKKEASQVNALKTNGSRTNGGIGSINSLVKGTLVEGQVKSENDIRVDGEIQGNLICKAKVIIGPSGFVHGSITCQNAIVEGRFEGTMNVKDLLHVKERADIKGEVTTNKLIVQAGAQFNVTCKMGNQSSSNERGAFRRTFEKKKVETVTG